MQWAFFRAFSSAAEQRWQCPHSCKDLQAQHILCSAVELLRLLGLLGLLGGGSWTTCVTALCVADGPSSPLAQPCGRQNQAQGLQPPVPESFEPRSHGCPAQALGRGPCTCEPSEFCGRRVSKGSMAGNVFEAGKPWSRQLSTSLIGTQNTALEATSVPASRKKVPKAIGSLCTHQTLQAFLGRGRACEEDAGSSWRA